MCLQRGYLHINEVFRVLAFGKWFRMCALKFGLKMVLNLQWAHDFSGEIILGTGFLISTVFALFFNTFTSFLTCFMSLNVVLIRRGDFALFVIEKVVGGFP